MAENNPIDIIKSMCEIGEDGFPILSPDIDIYAIMKDAGYRSAFEPKNDLQNLPANNSKEER